MKIFLVEDHKDTRELLGYYLEQHGHAVVSAWTMHEALIKLAAADFQVLISDIGLPDGNGWELLRRLGPTPPYAIAISGFGSSADESKSVAAGYRQHLIKPIRLEKLDALLAQAATELSLRLPVESPAGRPSD